MYNTSDNAIHRTLVLLDYPITDNTLPSFACASLGFMFTTHINQTPYNLCRIANLKFAVILPNNVCKIYSPHKPRCRVLWISRNVYSSYYFGGHKVFNERTRKKNLIVVHSSPVTLFLMTFPI